MEIKDFINTNIESNLYLSYSNINPQFLCILSNFQVNSYNYFEVILSLIKNYFFNKCSNKSYQQNDISEYFTSLGIIYFYIVITDKLMNNNYDKYLNKEGIHNNKSKVN